MAIVQDWKIRSRSHHCCHDGQPFADGEAFYTCIFADPSSDGYLRRDYSARSWPLVQQDLDPPPFSFWKSTYEAPAPEAKEEALEPRSAEAMLRRMIDEDDPATENARYILALMLERKKTLRPMEEKETEAGTKLIFYEHRATGDLFVIADPQLHLNDIGRVQAEVAALLGTEGGAGERPASPSSGDGVECPENPAPSPAMEPTEAPAARLIHKLKRQIDELVVQLSLGKAEAADTVEHAKEALAEKLAAARAALTQEQAHASLAAKLDHLRVQLALGRMESRDACQAQREKIHHAIEEAKEELHHLDETLREDLSEAAESLQNRLNTLALDLGLAVLVAEDELKTRKEEIAARAARLAERLKSAASSASEQSEILAREAGEAYEDIKDNLRRLLH